MSYRGLTWDHPRGYAALDASAEQADIVWDRHPLEGFESEDIATLAQRYDLIVLDHPHMGDAWAADCLTPLDTVFDADDMAAWRDATIGRAYDSYVYGRRLWAIPIDVATQVMALSARVEAPLRTWAEVEALPPDIVVALSLAGPHAFLSLASVAVALGHTPDAENAFLSASILNDVFAILEPIYARTPQATHLLNPIGMLEQIAIGAIDCTPLIYGYVNYADRVRYCDAPISDSRRRGSTLGGAGLALTRRCAVNEPLRAYLRWLMSEDAQARFIPAHAGQPSLRSAWDDPDLNARCGWFYRNTAETLETAWVRPRFPGFSRFQGEASVLIRSRLADRSSIGLLAERLNVLYRQTRNGQEV